MVQQVGAGGGQGGGLQHIPTFASKRNSVAVSAPAPTSDLFPANAARAKGPANKH